MQNLVFKGLNGQFKIVATTQYITRIKDSTKKDNISLHSHQLFIILIELHFDYNTNFSTILVLGFKSYSSK